MLSHSWFHRLLHPPKACVCLCPWDLSVFLGVGVLVCPLNRGRYPYTLSRPHVPGSTGRPKGVLRLFWQALLPQGQWIMCKTQTHSLLAGPTVPACATNSDHITEFINTWNHSARHCLEFMFCKYSYNFTIIITQLHFDYTKVNEEKEDVIKVKT